METRWWEKKTIKVWKQKIRIWVVHLTTSLHPSLFPLTPPTPSSFLSGSHPPALPLLFFFSPFSPLAPFFTYLPPLLLLLIPTFLVCLLMRAGGTIVLLMPVFGLKQSLFIQAVAQPGPSPSFQQDLVWLSLSHKCHNKPLCWLLHSSTSLCLFPLPHLCFQYFLLPLSPTVITSTVFSQSATFQLWDGVGVSQIYILLHIVHQQWPGESHLL